MNKYILFFILPLVISCGTGSTGKGSSIDGGVEPLASKNDNFNISILLDLSDRISTTEHPNQSMDYYKRDIGYISSITKAFESHLLTKKMILMNDKIKMYVQPEPSSSEINEIISNLDISFTKDNVTKEKVNSLNSIYADNTESLYNAVISQKDFPGARTWDFVTNKAKEYCIADGYRNILVILTDGQMFHTRDKREVGNRTTYITTRNLSTFGLTNGDWKNRFNDGDYGFLTETSEMSNLEVLVLGLNTYENQNPYAEDILREYWTKWLTEMGVKNFKILSADLPANLDESIKKFING